MLEKFQYTHTFLKQLWMAFIFVASLEESAPKRVDTHLKTGQTGSRTLRSMRSKDLDESPMPLPNKEPLYNREIERNKEIIKLTTLNYTEKVVEIYFNVKLCNILKLTRVIENKKQSCFQTRYSASPKTIPYIYHK